MWKRQPQNTRERLQQTNNPVFGRAGKDYFHRINNNYNNSKITTINPEGSRYPAQHNLQL
ncbi:MAG: hypothetical protein LBL39_08400 [Planctomycetaceae bacterium]|nr:hypothetical protein [Planctomycetaceae bacterium]